MQESFIPYGRQHIDEEDIRAVVAVLKSDWLTTGPLVPQFETAVACFTGAKFGVAVSSGTAALHAAVYAAGIGAGDEVIVPSLTFAATANAVLYVGAKPIFADILPDTLLLDPAQVEARITKQTKAIIAVDYAGQACDYEALRAIAKKHELTLIADACHAIGGNYHGREVGTLADLSCFSFHPVKHITTCEGGMVLTENEHFAQRMRRFRNHGISSDHRERQEKGSMHYEMLDLGLNYRLNDVQCALGLSQLQKLRPWVKRRNEIASQYRKAFSGDEQIEPLVLGKDIYHAYHLFVVRLDLRKQTREAIAASLRAQGIGVNVHYPPAHLHPYYRERFGYKKGLLPITEAAHENILSLPMYQDLSDTQLEKVIQALQEAVRR